VAWDAVPEPMVEYIDPEFFFTKATAAAATVTELVDRKRKAAVAAECDFNAAASMTRNCYDT
jgi:hypothetical protein